LDKLFVAGLTGPIGAGKSAVAAVLTEAGLPVLDADRLSRLAVKKKEVLDALVDAFSADILLPDGALDRARLAQLAFADPDATARLAAVTHPPILALANQWLMRMEQAHERAAVLEAPLLFESGMDARCDVVAVVLAPRAVRRARLIERGMSGEQIDARMDAQQKDTYYSERATIVLHNDGDMDALHKEAEALARQIREWAK